MGQHELVGPARESSARDAAALARLQSQLLVEQSASFAGPTRVRRLPARPIQRQHQLAAQVSRSGCSRTRRSRSGEPPHATSRRSAAIRPSAPRRRSFGPARPRRTKRRGPGPRVVGRARGRAPGATVAATASSPAVQRRRGAEARRSSLAAATWIIARRTRHDRPRPTTFLSCDTCTWSAAAANSGVSLQAVDQPIARDITRIEEQGE